MNANGTITAFHFSSIKRMIQTYNQNSITREAGYDELGNKAINALFPEIPMADTPILPADD